MMRISRRKGIGISLAFFLVLGVILATIFPCQISFRRESDTRSLISSLIDHLHNEDPERRDSAIKSLTALGPQAKASVPMLQMLATASSPSLRMRASVALWIIDDQAAPLLKELSDRYGQSLVQCVDMRHDKSVDGVLALRALISSLSQRWRIELGLLGGKIDFDVEDGARVEGRIAALAAQLRNKSPEIRRMAALAIWQFASPRHCTVAISSLTHALKDEDDLVCILVAKALGKIGPTATESLGAIRGCIRKERSTNLGIVTLLAFTSSYDILVVAPILCKIYLRECFLSSLTETLELIEKK